MKSLKTGLAAFAVMAFAAIAFAQSQGLFGNYPVVGSPSYCSTTNNNNCVSTIPAGPALTGNETIIVQTNSNSLPANAAMKLASLGTGPYQYAAPLTNTAVDVAATSRRLVLEPAGTIAALTVMFPISTTLVDNQTFGICTTQIVTALTLVGRGATISGTVTALSVPATTGAASCPEWVYRSSNTTWYRIH